MSGAVLAGAKVTVAQYEDRHSSRAVASSTGDYVSAARCGRVRRDGRGRRFSARNPPQRPARDQRKGSGRLRAADRRDAGTGGSDRLISTLRTDDATLGQTIEQRRVEELPLNNRSLGALAILQPGVHMGRAAGPTARDSDSDRADRESLSPASGFRSSLMGSGKRTSTPRSTGSSSPKRG